jgi:hypothetical protein
MHMARWEGAMLSARKVSFVICTLLVSGYSAVAADRPSRLLKDIKIVSYQTFLEKTAGGNGCKIDEDNLNTSLQFIANQSTALKLITEREKAERESELHDRLRRLSSEASARLARLSGDQMFSQYQKDQDTLKAAGAAADKYTFMPRLMISLHPYRQRADAQRQSGQH